MTSPSRKIREKRQSDREKLQRKIMAFSASLESKLAIIHTIATKWKEKYDALVEDCHHRLCSCSDRLKMSP